MEQYEIINLENGGNPYGLKKLLRMEEVAEILDVSLGRAYELARLGLLPVVKLGRQLRVDGGKLTAWIEQGGQALPGSWKRG